LSRRITLTAFALLSTFIAVTPARAQNGPYDPQVGSGAKDAIPRDSSAFQEWASSVVSFNPGPQDIATPGSPLANTGSAANALGDAGTLVSLGDGGSITLSFSTPIANGPGADLAVFENGFASGGSGLAYLELATVSVSSDGIHFYKFPDVSLTQTQTQVGGFGLLDASNLYDLAGKYVAGYGTPFDLSELAGVSPFLNVNDITEVKITDVVGSINPLYGTRDSLGNLINDPFPTPFASSGFDLTGVGVLNEAVPEPSSLILGLSGLAVLALVERRRRRRISSMILN
jgi:PEP-CTERM motif